MHKYTSAATSSSLLEKDPAFRVITVTKETGLGLKILGGINRNEGPLVYIQEVIPGGDCYKDGRLKPGDQLVSVNKESMIGVSFEEAKNIITRAKLRSESLWEIAFIRQKSYSGHLGNISCPSSLQASEDCGLQTSTFNPLSPPHETLIPKTSSTPKTQGPILPSFKAIEEAKAVAEETRALRSRIHLAEAAQRQAHGMEMDYEEVIHLLEAEISELKAQLADYSDQNKESVQDLRKRVTVLDCQLRKSEMARKTFKASTERLLHFVEAAQEVLLDSSAPLSSLSERRAGFASQTSLPQLGRNGRSFPATLLLESKELVRSVRAILDMDCLPYGWEAAYTADGIKYFINHVTQTTSWIHPMMSVLNLSCSEENEENCPRELTDQKS
ncbi:syntaxin-binding protein 4 [Peromyscus leucopus]|uniref:syntaxin-binding protein 4 n=1 Tax=Peromyscus leucopus TaxID=10041 RepID=UPI00188527BA|nr:syntaxin-binding protein 4 [Peromyscus leucopus]